MGSDGQAGVRDGNPGPVRRSVIALRFQAPSSALANTAHVGG
jgi:hypothetical protein